MSDNRQLAQWVQLAKEDIQEADSLIRAYMPFVKSETAKFLKRPPMEGYDDELSIAMIAFHEAIGSYSHLRGTFLNYAAMMIRSRLVDYWRRERRHSKHLSLDEPAGENDHVLSDFIDDGRDCSTELAVREATCQEIEELTEQLIHFGVSLSDVADNCPKQQRTLQACRKALEYVGSHPLLMEEFLRTRRLPIGQLTVGSGVERKTLERHRKYLVALLLIHTNGYEIIRGHLKAVMKGASTS